MRWFRMHSDAISNPKLKLLAFEDRWHFVALCCMKAEGLLDDDKDEQLKARLIATQLGLTVRDAEEVKRRLCEVDLLLDDWSPKGWDKHQYASDNSTDRVRKFREKNHNHTKVKRKRNVSVTPPDTDTDTDTDKKHIGSDKPTKFVLPSWIPKDLWSEWMDIRRRKKAVNTKRAMEALVTKLGAIQEAGIPPEKAIATAIEKSWKGIELEWLKNTGGHTNGRRLSKLEAALESGLRERPV